MPDNRVRKDAARRERLRRIYEANYAAVLGYALRRFPADEAEEIVAETFLTAWRRLDVVPEGVTARVWLYATARRVAANQRRGAVRRARLSDRLRDDAGRRDAVDLAAETNSGTVADAFERLSPADRELLALVAWEGLSPRELAVVLGCSTNAARIRLHRARRRFVNELERRDPAEVSTLSPGWPRHLAEESRAEQCL